jgi:hypothetical protein
MKPQPLFRPELFNHPLAVASKEVNDYAETHGLDATCKHYGLTQEDVHYIAMQRALRAVFAFYGRNFNPKQLETVQLSATEIKDQIKYAAAYMDGLVIGWRAREIHDEQTKSGKAHKSLDSAKT